MFLSILSIFVFTSSFILFDIPNYKYRYIKSKNTTQIEVNVKIENFKTKYLFVFLSYPIQR